jgi:hypothetical protein
MRVETAPSRRPPEVPGSLDLKTAIYPNPATTSIKQQPTLNLIGSDFSIDTDPTSALTVRDARYATEC